MSFMQEFSSNFKKFSRCMETSFYPISNYAKLVGNKCVKELHFALETSG